jgi:GDP-L-fucose synthase
MIEANLIEAARRVGVDKLLFLGSSCVYPKVTEQPIREEALLTGALEPTNQWYAIAKIAGIKLARAYRVQYGCDFISVMPSNLYGPNDTYDLAASHVIPALLVKAHLAKLAAAPAVEVWGTGRPRREFLHVDDLANACIFAMKHYSADEHLNIGSGTDVSIRELAGLISEVVGFYGDLKFDASKPDGTPQKLMDVGRIAALGWRPRISLREGLESTYRAFLADVAHRFDSGSGSIQPHRPDAAAPGDVVEAARNQIKAAIGP